MRRTIAVSAACWHQINTGRRKAIFRPDPGEPDPVTVGDIFQLLIEGDNDPDLSPLPLPTLDIRVTDVFRISAGESPLVGSVISFNLGLEL